MNAEKMTEAGKQLSNFSYTDDELQNCLNGARLALAFLHGAGEKWALATSPLRYEVDRLCGFQKERQKNA